jgi:hypothetical protein
VRIVGSIIVPSQFRSKGPKSKGMNGEADAFEDMERSRVEGEDALTWLCSDMSVYVTIVTDTVSATLPKMAVMILCERVISNELLHILQKRALQVCRFPCSRQRLVPLLDCPWLCLAGWLVTAFLCLCCTLFLRPF